MIKAKICPKVCIVLFLILSVMTIAAQNANASGYSIFTQSASSLGQGAAVVSHTESPSTIFFNPALMNRLEGTQIEIGTTVLLPNREFKSDSTGRTYETKDDVFFPSTFYLTTQVNSIMSAGVGFFSPFGLGTDWGNSWEGRYITTRAELESYTLNPAVSFKITPRMSLAAGLDIIFLDATFKSKIPSVMGDLGQKFNGSGTGVGYNLGLLYDFNGSVSLGMAYRSQIRVDLNGDGSFDAPLNYLNSTGGAKVTLPRQLFAGVSYKGSDRWVLEAGVRWEDWSSFEKLDITLDNGMASTQPRDWKDTYAFNIGGQYKYSDMLKLRAGYLYGKNPVPDSTFEPIIPDSDTHLFTVGAGFSFGKAELDMAYGYQLQKDRNKQNPIGAPFGTAKGEYKADMHILAASLKYRF